MDGGEAQEAEHSGIERGQRGVEVREQRRAGPFEGLVDARFEIELRGERRGQRAGNEAGEET